MDLQEARNIGLFSKKIEIGEHFQKPANEVWVVLREPNSREISKLMGNSDPEGANTAFGSLLPSLIIDHCFTTAEGKAKTEDVAQLIMDSASLYLDVFMSWESWLPLVKKRTEA